MTMRRGSAIASVAFATSAVAIAASDPSTAYNTTLLLPELDDISTATAPASIEWTRCDFPSASGVDRDDFDCATLAVPVCYADVAPCSLGSTRTHELRALRRQTTNATAVPTVWIVSESVDDDNTAAVMERVAQLHNGSAINVYAMQSRLWNPPQDDRGLRSPCGTLATDAGARLEIDSTAIDAATACHAWLVDTFGTNATNAFSLDTATRDLATALQLVYSQDLENTATPNLYVLAMGKGSWVVQRLMSQRQINVSVAGYIFDTPHAMAMPPNYDETVGTSMGRFLDACESNLECDAKFKNLSLSMREVLTKVEAAVELPDDQMPHCAAMLRNATFNEDRDLKPAHGVRRHFAALRRSVVGVKVAAPLLYRLERCNDKDPYGVEKLLGAVSTTLSWSVREALAAFVERVVAYSEFWPTPPSSRDTLVAEFEKSLVSDGAMVAQQPSYCLYSASDAPECIALYKRNPLANATLKMTYATPLSRSGNVSTHLVGSTSADVLILASRVSLAGSASVGSDLYDAFTATNRSAILIETDNFEAATELEGPAKDTETLLQVIGAFVTKQAAPLHGKWRLVDLSITAADWSKAKSTYGTSSDVVAMNFTITQEERSSSVLLAQRNMYEFVKYEYSRTYRPSSLLDDDSGIPYGYGALLLGGLLLLSVYMVWARRKRDDAAALEEQRRYEEPPPVHVNVVMPPPYMTDPNPVYSQTRLPSTPHAIPIHRPQRPPMVYSNACEPPAQSLPPLASTRQWRSEPVNGYTNSYTPIAGRSMRSAL